MAKLTDIKFRIDQLDGGTFQTLCDVYLKCRGYGIGYSLGMNTGTFKTAKGNPDTYFLAADNKYVFVMYTTQKTDFVKKAFASKSSHVRFHMSIALRFVLPGLSWIVTPVSAYRNIIPDKL